MEKIREQVQNIE
ncbi:MAG: hypothetical protein GX244_04820 [Firmicutes bacterium]|nr:hypothetical protein [Bacillota bacterium]